MKSGIEKTLIVGLFIYCSVFLIATQVRAENTSDSPAIRHYLSGDIILIENLSDTTLSSYSSGDTFEIGSFSDIGWKKTDNDYDILNYLNNPIRYDHNELLIWDNPLKNIYYIQEILLKPVTVENRIIYEFVGIKKMVVHK